MARMFQTVDSKSAYLKLFKNGKLPIGKGSFGVVNKVVNKNNDKVVAAIKQTDLSRLQSKAQDYTIQEVSRIHFGNIKGRDTPIAPFPT